MGYASPIVFRDTRKYVQGCDSCCRMAEPTQSDEIPLQPQLMMDPFKRFDLDFLGPINPPSQQKTYVLVCIDYVIKWVEEKVPTRETEHGVSNFLFEGIFSQYGV